MRRGVIDEDPALGHHLLDVSKAQRVCRVPMHANQQRYERVVHLLNHSAQRFAHLRGVELHRPNMSPCAIATEPTLVLFAASAWAQGFPSKPIRMVVSFAPGGPTDLVIHLIADKRRIDLGQSIIIDNKPGARGAIAAEYVARAPADGDTILYAGSSLTMLPTVAKVNCDPVKDFAPISQVSQLAIFLVVRPDVPVHTVSELVNCIKANPGKLNYGSVGTGNVTYFQAEQFNILTGTDMLHGPYKGSAPALTDMVGGRLQLMFDSYATSGPYSKVCCSIGLPYLPDARIPGAARGSCRIRIIQFVNWI